MRQTALFTTLALVIALSVSNEAGAWEPAISPILRVAPGAAFHIAPPAGRAITQSAVDLTAGVGLGELKTEGMSLQLMSEAGYSYDHLGSHAFSFAGGVGAGNQLFAVLYHPRFLIGSSPSGSLLGVRNGVGIHVINDVYSLEVAHQAMFVGEAVQHDVRVMLGMNPLGLLRFLPAFKAFGLLVDTLDR